MTLTRHGTEEQKQEILPGLAAGRTQFCLALTEPDAGSNAIAISTAARRDGDDWLIKGQKIWISNVENARSEEHTSELQSLMRISYAVFCLKKKHTQITLTTTNTLF